MKGMMTGSSLMLGVHGADEMYDHDTSRYMVVYNSLFRERVHVNPPVSFFHSQPGRNGVPKAQRFENQQPFG